MENQEVSGALDAVQTLRFFWHVDGVVAGSARPGRYGDLRKELLHLQSERISLIVNLCTERLALPAEFKGVFEELHEPVADGHPPEEDQLERILAAVKKAAAEGRRTVIHCRGGVGRTATVLIPLMMVLEGLTLAEAVARLRKAGRYTQTMQQWEFIQNWAEKQGKI